MSTTEYMQERREYWTAQIAECDASGMTQHAWCREHNICTTSMSTWRTRLNANRIIHCMRPRAQHIEEETAFVDVTSLCGRDTGENVASMTMAPVGIEDHPFVPEYQEMPRYKSPDAVIGFGNYTVGVYENTSTELMGRIMEVLRHA